MTFEKSWDTNKSAKELQAPRGSRDSFNMTDYSDKGSQSHGYHAASHQSKSRKGRDYKREKMCGIKRGVVRGHNGCETFK